MGTKIASTFTIDKDVKKEFKMECTLNDVEMSDTIEFMMTHYVTASKDLRKIQNETKPVIL